MKDRRVGKFLIYNRFIEQDPESVKKIMSECIVLRAESLHHMDAIEYVAMCERFDEVPNHEIVATYEWLFRRDGDKVKIDGVRKL